MSLSTEERVPDERSSNRLSERWRMRLGNLKGRLVIVEETVATDVDHASDGRFGPDPQSVFDRWGEFVSWASSTAWSASREEFSLSDLEAPVPAPRQVFAAGLNYLTHAEESGLGADERHLPVIFTKFPSCIASPSGTVNLPGAPAMVDWEIELVVVIGRHAHEVRTESAWTFVAGLTAGQDISDRTRQFAGQPPQFCVGKSLPGFGPTGPFLVTPDELDDPGDLALGCTLNGETVQEDRTSSMVLSVPALIEYISSAVPLLPGDLIFTGTPSGVGMYREPPRYVKVGDRLDSYVEGIGELHQVFKES